MASIEIQAMAKDSGGIERTEKALYDFGDNLEHARSLFGDEVVFRGFMTNARSLAQTVIRQGVAKGLSTEKIQEKLSSWKPGVPASREGDVLKSAEKHFLSLSKEAQERYIESLKAKLSA